MCYYFLGEPRIGWYSVRTIWSMTCHFCRNAKTFSTHTATTIRAPSEWALLWLWSSSSTDQHTTRSRTHTHQIVFESIHIEPESGRETETHQINETMKFKIRIKCDTCRMNTSNFVEHTKKKSHIQNIQIIMNSIELLRSMLCNAAVVRTVMKKIYNLSCIHLLIFASSSLFVTILLNRMNVCEWWCAAYACMRVRDVVCRRHM